MAMRGFCDAELASIRQAFTDWINRNPKKRIDILITGKTGVGKSRLVNGLVGKHVTEEGRKRDSCTNTVTPYEAITIEGIEVVVWDSPGLQDGTCDEELYVANLKEIELMHDIDVVIYCLKMDATRFYSEDKKAIRKLTEGFGKKLWKKTVIALTFANKVEDPDGGDELAFFEGELAEWKRQIHGILTELDIDSQFRNAFAIVPAGNYTKLRLPNIDNWLADLWTSCYCAMNDAASVAFYLINKHRLRFTGSEALAAATVSSPGSQPEDAERAPSVGEGSDPAEDIPKVIPLNEEQKDAFWKRMWRGFCDNLLPTLSFLVDVLSKVVDVVKLCHILFDEYKAWKKGT